ncbi:MAG: carbohydrate ABC transporter permease [Vallitalea sp.]|nr:carbohydrate ABC transporter permease [Vallitalea sp.]
MKTKKNNVIRYILLIAGSLLTIGPLLWMIITSLKTYQETIAIPPTFLPKHYEWQNFVEVYNDFSFGNLFINTFIVIFCVVIVQTFISLLAAYAFAKLDFPCKNILFVLLLSILMVPCQIFLIPQYNIIVGMKLSNTLLALMIPSFFSVFSLFFFRQFLYGIPKSIDEAAKIDGASYFKIFFRIIIPLSKSAITSIGILTALATWRNLMWPIIINRSINKMTLAAGLSFLIGEHTTYYQLVMAGGVISTIPIIIIFIFFQKHIVDGIATTGLKG